MSENHPASLTLDRLKAYSDSIFAFAVTLLVYNIVVPTITNPLDAGELFMKLVGQWQIFLTYFLSVALIGIFWIGHTIMLHFIVRADRKFYWLNTLLVASIAILPFPTSILAKYPDNSTALRVYGGVLFFTSMIFSYMWHFASKNHHLIEKNLPYKTIKLGKKVVFFAPIIYFVGIISTFFSIRFCQVLFLLIPMLYLIPSPIDKLVKQIGNNEREN